MECGQAHTLRADARVHNIATKNMQGRNLAIVRSCLQKPIVTVVSVCISQITLQKVVKFIIRTLK